MSGPPCPKGGMRLSEALDNMQLSYNPITKQLHFVSPKIDKSDKPDEDVDRLSKKSSFSDEGNFSISTCEKSDTSDSPKSTLQWGGSVTSGHKRGKDGGSFSSTVSSLSECSLGSSASKEDEGLTLATEDDPVKLKKKGLSGFFSRGVFPWKNTKHDNPAPDSKPWRIFGSKSSGNLAAKALEGQKSLTPCSSGANTPHHHRRQGSSASEKQFEDLVASSIALIQHDRPSNLPAKCSEEATRHRAEHARMVEAARRKVEREAVARHAKLQESIKMEERLARHAREWTQTVLPEWHSMKNSKRTLELWWSGLPPSIRGRVWQLAIDNKLNITSNMYQDYVEKAKQKLLEAQQRRKRLKINRRESCGCRKVASLVEKEIKPSTDDGMANEVKSDDSEGNSKRVDKEDGKHDDAETNCKGDYEDSKPRLGNNENCSANSDRLPQENLDAKMNDLPEDRLPKTQDLKSDKTQKVKDDLQEDCLPKTEDLSKFKDISETEENTKAIPRISIPRNYSEQNLKSKAVIPPSKCCSKSNPNLLEYSDECSMELIQLDIARTFPHLCIFQPGGPYFDVLHELLAAYVCYRPDIGYVQGMSFIAAVLILNMEAPQAFVCFANLLDGPVLRAAFTRDGDMMQRLWKAYSTLLSHNLPALADRVAPELYLLEWLYTAFAKAMPLDAACRVWDVFLRDGDTFLFNTALGILHLYQDELKDLDFIAAAQFLTKLPEDLCPEALFRSILSVSMTIDGMSFEELVSCCEVDSSLDDDVVRL